MPNLALRERDIQAFEDTPLEYVRGELQVSEVATPRQAAADVVKALVGVGPDSESATTALVLEWIGRALAEAAAARDSEEGWKSKDAAVYVFEAVATRSMTLSVRFRLTTTTPVCFRRADVALRAARRDGYEPEREYRAVVRR